VSNSVDAMVVSATLVELPESLPSDLSDVAGRKILVENVMLVCYVKTGSIVHFLIVLFRDFCTALLYVTYYNNALQILHLPTALARQV